MAAAVADMSREHIVDLQVDRVGFERIHGWTSPASRRDGGS
jgi:hypothetical protein